MRNGWWILHTLVLGLIGAAIVHIVVLLLLPRYSDDTTWSRIASAVDPYEPVRLSEIEGLSVSNDDPLFQIIGCRFDLQDGIVRFRTEGEVPYWSVSIFDNSGANIYSFNDRTSSTGALDFVVLTPAQTGEVRKDMPAELQASSFIETGATEGLAVIRAFVPDQTWVPAANGFLSGVSCRPI